MPRGYWCIGIAVVVAFAPLAAALGQYDFPDGQPAVSQDHQSTDDRERSTQATVLAKGNNSPNNNKSRCDDGIDCAWEDLLAQKSVAVSTAKIVVQSWWQIGTAILSVIIGGATAVFAWLAARAARDAVVAAQCANKAANEGARAAEKQVTIMEETTRRLERPYIFMICDTKWAEKNGADKVAVIRCFFRNYGRLPAIITRISTLTFDDSSGVYRLPIGRDDGLYIVLPPNEQCGPFEAPVKDGRPGFQYQGADLKRLVVRAVVHSKGAAGEIYTDNFCVRVTGSQTFTVDSGNPYNRRRVIYP